MIHAWYEKNRDQKDCIYFALHDGVNYARNTNLFPSFHNSIEFAFGIEGSMEIVINGEVHVLKAGDVCFIDSREPHRYYYTPDVKCYIVLISTGFFTDDNRLGEVSFATHTDGGEQFEILERYLAFSLSHWDEDSLLCKRAFADGFAYLMTRYYPSFPKREMKRQSAALLESVKYICEHCTERLTVGGVAKVFGYSANYFSTAFNEFMGSSFTDYVNTCRIIEYYRIRKQSPTLSVGKAAELCGFGSVKSFYRAMERFSHETSDFEPPKRTVNRI